jgi:purine-nucleoside phosphorylase
LRRFFNPSPPVLTPADLVCTFTKKRPEELTLPYRVIITVSGDDTRFLRRRLGPRLLDAWLPFRRIYQFKNSQTALARTWYGGPNIASLVEELSAFGVREFCLWGYMGGIASGLSTGDVVLASGALREEGVSYHYLDDQEDTVYSEWARNWSLRAADEGFTAGIVWSCDALYRETVQKLETYGQRGILGVEMEVASLYAVCAAKGLKAVAFLGVSDVFREGTWIPGFFTKEFMRGAERLGTFLQEHAIA